MVLNFLQSIGEALQWLIFEGGLFLGAHLQQIEVPRLEVESEQQLPAYTTATAMPDASHVCDLHHNSQQCQMQATSVTYTTTHSNAKPLTR